MKISELAHTLQSKNDEINFIAAYEWNKHIKVYVNKFEGVININSLRLFCIENIGPGAASKYIEENIVIDYGDKGMLAFYQFEVGCWLIIASSKRGYALVNLDINQFRSEEITFDLEDIKEEEVEVLIESFDNEEVLLHKTESKIDERLLAAQRLQLSILPDLTVMNEFFEKHFSFYSPEDVLSGDFYWVRKKGDDIFIILADCTGHSVEGALATMTVSALLEQSLVDDPEQTIRKVYQGLKKPDQSLNAGYAVGVEMALCKFNQKTFQTDIVTTGVLALYIKGEEEQQLIRTKTIKNSDAAEIDLQKFSFKASKGERLVMYSDGLPDQFDKDDKKKLSNGGVRNMFLSMNDKFTATEFEKRFDKWKGSTGQLDDITVIAIEF